MQICDNTVLRAAQSLVSGEDLGHTTPSLSNKSYFDNMTGALVVGGGWVVGGWWWWGYFLNNIQSRDAKICYLQPISISSSC